VGLFYLEESWLIKRGVFEPTFHLVLFRLEFVSEALIMHSASAFVYCTLL